MSNKVIKFVLTNGHGSEKLCMIKDNMVGTPDVGDTVDTVVDGFRIFFMVTNHRNTSLDDGMVTVPIVPAGPGMAPPEWESLIRFLLNGQSKNRWWRDEPQAAPA